MRKRKDCDGVYVRTIRQDRIKAHMQVIPDEGESVRPNKKSNLSEFMYHEQDDNTVI